MHYPKYLYDLANERQNELRQQAETFRLATMVSESNRVKFKKSINLRRFIVLLLIIFISTLVIVYPTLANDPDEVLDKSFGLQDTFNEDGQITIGGGAWPNGLAIQPDGKIVIVGQKSQDFWAARYHSDGRKDDTFNGSGEVTTFFSIDSYERAQDVAIQADGKIVVVGLAHTDFGVARFNADGSLDNDFGEFGRVTTDFDGDFDEAEAVAIQTDGKIVVGGGAADCGKVFCFDKDFGIARYNPDGSPDTSFNNGFLFTGFGGQLEGISSLIIQPDGKILGIGDNYGAGELLLARYNQADGSPDTTFSVDGKIETTELGPGWDVDIQPDGKIVVVGEGKVGRFTNSTPLLWDQSFGDNGKVTLPFPVEIDQKPWKVRVQPNQGIIVAGAVNDPSSLIVARYTTAGELDKNFGQGLGYVLLDFDTYNMLIDMEITPDGQILLLHWRDPDSYIGTPTLTRLYPDGSLDNGGRVTTNVASQQIEQIHATALQSTGDIVAVGQQGNSRPLMILARYRPNGNLDSNFGSRGIIKYLAPGGPVRPSTIGYATVVDAQDRIFIAGAEFRGSKSDIALWRYGPNGTLDFHKTIDLGGEERARAIALQPDGKIVVTGETETAGLPIMYFLARFNDDGSLDNSFTGGGFTFGNFNNHGNPGVSTAITIQPDGKILVAGWHYDNGNYNFGVARYLSDGNTDNSFGEKGLISLDIGPRDFAKTIVLQSDDKILVGGNGGANSEQMILARYTADGQPDTFGVLGVTVATFDHPAQAHALAIEADGGIVLAGCLDGDLSPMAVARFTAAGQPDNSFSQDGKAIFALGNGPSCVRAIAQNPNNGNLYVAGYAQTDFDDWQFALARLQDKGPLDGSPEPEPTDEPTVEPTSEPTAEPTTEATPTPPAEPNGSIRVFLPVVMK